MLAGAAGLMLAANVYTADTSTNTAASLAAVQKDQVLHDEQTDVVNSHDVDLQMFYAEEDDSASATDGPSGVLFADTLPKE